MGEGHIEELVAFAAGTGTSSKIGEHLLSCLRCESDLRLLRAGANVTEPASMNDELLWHEAESEARVASAALIRDLLPRATALLDRLWDSVAEAVHGAGVAVLGRSDIVVSEAALGFAPVDDPEARAAICIMASALSTSVTVRRSGEQDVSRVISRIARELGAGNELIRELAARAPSLLNRQR